MDSRVKITKGGDVYMYIPTECVEIMRSYQYDLVVFPLDKPMSVDDYESTGLLDLEDEEVFVHVGTMTDMHVERIDMFPTLESIAEFVRQTGRVPWGVSAIARRNKWRRVSEAGVSLTLHDQNGRVLRYYRKEGRAEIE